jgi:hypothetical protein
MQELEDLAVLGPRVDRRVGAMCQVAQLQVTPLIQMARLTPPFMTTATRMSCLSNSVNPADRRPSLVSSSRCAMPTPSRELSVGSVDRSGLGDKSLIGLNVRKA